MSVAWICPSPSVSDSLTFHKGAAAPWSLLSPSLFYQWGIWSPFRLHQVISFLDCVPFLRYVASFLDVFFSTYPIYFLDCPKVNIPDFSWSYRKKCAQCLKGHNSEWSTQLVLVNLILRTDKHPEYTHLFVAGLALFICLLHLVSGVTGHSVPNVFDSLSSCCNIAYFQ